MSGRKRGRVRFTAACNSYFQGLGADATGDAIWLVGQAMYNETASPLYGTRLVNFIHDELIGEVDLATTYWAVCSLCKGSGQLKEEPCHACQASGRGLVSPRAHHAVLELRRLMAVAANQWLPDVPFKVEEIEPCLMAHWSKKAATVIGEDGAIQVWRGAA
jgi:hypothetical protein